MTGNNPWAIVDEDNIVLSVQIATHDWIEQNPLEAPLTWRISPGTDSPGYAGIGFTWDEPTGWYIPPSPSPDAHFDREHWCWVWDTPAE